MNTERTSEPGQQLVLEDDGGYVLRTYKWTGQPVHVVRRGDTKRLELVSTLELFKKNRIPYDFLGDLSAESLKSGEFAVGSVGKLRLLPRIENTIRDEAQDDEHSKEWYFAVGGLLLAALIGIRPLDPKANECRRRARD